MSTERIPSLVVEAQEQLRKGNMSRREFLRLATMLGVSFAGASALAACAPAVAPTSAPVATSASVAPTLAPTLAALSAVSGGSLVYAIGAEPDTLDCPNEAVQTSEMVGRLINDGLVAFSPNIEIVPGLAQKWDLSPDGLVYTFYLRPNAMFHDGTPADANAAKFCIDRMLTEQVVKASLQKGVVKETKVVDATTLQITLITPFATYLNNLAHVSSSIYSPAAFQKYGKDIAIHPVGSGPFQFVEWSKGNQIVVKRWDGSWRGKPYLDQVTFKVAPDETSRTLMLQSGDVQLIAFVPPETATLLSTNKDVNVQMYQTARVLGLSLNNQWGPFKDVRVRQALNYALDKDSIVKNLYQGHAKVSGGPAGPLIVGSYDVAPYPYDPVKAKDLLTQAGYANGFDVTLLSPKARFLKDAELVQEVQRQLGQVGVRVKLNVMEYAAFTAAQFKPLDQTDVQMFLQGWVPSTGETRWTMFALFHSTQWVNKGSNGSFYSSPTMDDLVNKATAAANIQQRDDYLKQAQQLAHDDAVWAYLIATPQIAAWSKKLHDPWLSGLEYVTASEKTWRET